MRAVNKRKTAWTATIRCTSAAALSALLLAGCVTDRDKGLCPGANILAPASVLTVFRTGGPEDPSGELYTVWMSNVKTACDFDKHEITTDSKVRIQFKATRAPSAEGGTYNVPYFVAVTHKGTRIMTKKLFVAHVTFAPGEVSTDFEDTIDSTFIKIARGNKIGEYEILTGFQLTQKQLDYNIKMNHFAP
jgi:hypothetical protein